MELGVDLKCMFNRLRLAIENYLILMEQSSKPVNRTQLNYAISQKLSKANSIDGPLPDPINLKKRLTKQQLIDKYLSQLPLPIKGGCIKDESVEGAIGGVMMQVLINPNDFTQCTSSSFGSGTKQESLLKPKSERVIPPKSIQRNSVQESEQIVPVTTPAMNNSRLNLLNALNKAKKQSQTVQAKPTPPPTPPPAAATQMRAAAAKRKRPAVNRTLTPSPSSSTGESVGSSKSSDEETPPTVYGKEAFLRVLELCSPSYKERLEAIQVSKKRRVRTSTARGDFHYGKMDVLFEVSIIIFSSISIYNC